MLQPEVSVLTMTKMIKTTMRAIPTLHWGVGDVTIITTKELTKRTNTIGPSQALFVPLEPLARSLLLARSPTMTMTLNAAATASANAHSANNTYKNNRKAAEAPPPSVEWKTGPQPSRPPLPRAACFRAHASPHSSQHGSVWHTRPPDCIRVVLYAKAFELPQELCYSSPDEIPGDSSPDDVIWNTRPPDCPNHVIPVASTLQSTKVSELPHELRYSYSPDDDPNDSTMVSQHPLPHGAQPLPVSKLPTIYAERRPICLISCAERDFPPARKGHVWHARPPNYRSSALVASTTSSKSLLPRIQLERNATTHTKLPRSPHGQSIGSMSAKTTAVK